MKNILKVERSSCVKGALIEIMPYEKVDLTKYFDSVEADIKSDLSNWKSVKRELYEIR